jgi:hypothetical protein
MVPPPRQIFADRIGRMIRIAITPTAYAEMAATLALTGWQRSAGCPRSSIGAGVDFH